MGLFRAKPAPADDKTSIGNVLLELGLVTRVQLDEALQRQAARAPLGAILVEMGAVTDEQLEHALAHQALRRGDRKAAERVLAAEGKTLRKATDDFTQLAALARETR